MATLNVSEIGADRLLTHPGYVVTHGAATVAIKDGAISALTPAELPARASTLMMPALADAHDHGRGLSSLAFGVQDQALELWLPMLSQEPRVDPYLRAAVAFGHLAQSGIAALNHCHNPQNLRALPDEAKAVARAAQEVGIRVAFGVPLRDRNYLAYGDPSPIRETIGEADFKMLMDRIYRPAIDEQLAWVDAIAEFEHPLFHVQYAPVGPQWCSEELLARIAKASARDGRRIHMHLFETKRQREWADAYYPDGLIGMLDSIGFLSDRLTLAHGVWLKPAECELLAARGVTISVNTSSNLRLRSGLAPVKSFIAAGLDWTMGLDGMAFDDDADALRELRLLWLNQQRTGIKDSVSRAALCDAVFVKGRRTITPVGGGAIAPGHAADLIVLDYAGMTADLLDGALDELEILLTRARKEYVKSVIVAGREIVRDGVLRSIDLAAAQAELWAQARAAWPSVQTGSDLRRRLHAAVSHYYECGCHRVTH